MDPFSAAASVVSLLDTITRLGRTISQFKEDYRLADADLELARQHALLLKEEIRSLNSKGWSGSPQPHQAAEMKDGLNFTSESRPSSEDGTFEKAMSVAGGLLSTLEASFPLRSEPHTWRSKVRWAIKDKQVLLQLRERLKSAEITLQGIAALEQL